MTSKQYWFNQVVGLTLILFGVALSSTTATGHHMIGLGLLIVASSHVIRSRRKLQAVKMNASNKNDGGAAS